MLLAYKEHEAKIETIRDYISTLKSISLIPMQSLSEGSSKALLQYVSLLQKRRYDYSLIIITLYGTFESFIEEIARAYLRKISSYIKTYSDLPGVLTKNHLDLSAKLISNYSVKYSYLSKEDIVSNLNSCLSQSGESYKLNIEAFTQHTANYRIEIIRELFNSLGVENIECVIKKSDSLISFFEKEENYSEEEIKALPDAKYFEILGDLVQRRNLIAHGSDIEDLLSLDILDQYSKYILAMMESIYIILANNFYEMMVSKNIASNLGSPIRVIDNRIICINSSNLQIKKGQVLIGKKSNGSCNWGYIESMQLDGKDICELEPDKAVDVGLGVSFMAKDTYTYYVFPA